MGDNTACGKIALLIGSSAIFCAGLAVADSKGQGYIPTATYITVKSFTDPFQFQTKLKNEVSESFPLDDPIQVPVVKLMKFKFGKPEEMKFVI